MESNITQTPTISPEKKLTSEEKDIAQSIENFPSLESRDKIFILLVWRGFKTASPVSLFDASKETAESLEKVLQKAGLLYEPGEIITKPTLGLNPGRIYFIANNQADLNSLQDLWFGDHENDPEVYAGIGRMSGFPDSAIALYSKFAGLEYKKRIELMNDLTLSYKEKEKICLELYLDEPEVLAFSKFFFMSREHGKEEIKRVRNWTSEIKLLAPELLKEFMKINKINK